MEKKDVPQDPSALDKFTKEVYYVLDEKGFYVTEKSRGWEVKAIALETTWQHIHMRASSARLKVINGEASPIIFFMELKLMDFQTLSSYTGYWQWQIRRHLSPSIFYRLSEKKLYKYAAVFEVTIEQLKKMEINED